MSHRLAVVEAVAATAEAVAVASTAAVEAAFTEVGSAEVVSVVAEWAAASEALA